MKTACAVILAAGEGTRMKSDFPKVLHEVLGKPLITYPVEAARGAGISKVVLVGGSNRAVLQKLFEKKTRVVLQSKRLGTGHAVLAAAAEWKSSRGNLLIMPGDAPLADAETLRALLKQHESSGARATVLSAAIENPRGYGRIIRDASGDVIAIREELDASTEEKAVCEVNSGIYVFDARSLWNALALIRKSAKKKEYYLTDAVEILARQGLKVNAFTARKSEVVLGVNNRLDLSVVTKYLLRRNIEKQLEAGVTVIDPGTVYIEEDVRIGRDTVIYPFTYIEKGVAIGSQCKIGPFCKIRADSTIADGAEIGSFVEIVRSKIGSKTRVKHLSYIGDAILGKDVNVGAGTITANYDGKNKHQTRVGDRAFIGSDTVLIAPVRLGSGVKTGAGSVLTRNSDIPAGKVVVGIPARILKGSVNKK